MGYPKNQTQENDKDSQKLSCKIQHPQFGAFGWFSKNVLIGSSAGNPGYQSLYLTGSCEGFKQRSCLRAGCDQ